MHFAYVSDFRAWKGPVLVNCEQFEIAGEDYLFLIEDPVPPPFDFWAALRCHFICIVLSLKELWMITNEITLLPHRAISPFTPPSPLRCDVLQFHRRSLSEAHKNVSLNSSLTSCACIFFNFFAPYSNFMLSFSTISPFRHTFAPVIILLSFIRQANFQLFL